MTLINKSLMAAAVLAMAGGGVAQAAPVSPASKLSIAANARVGAPAKLGKKSQIGGGSTILYVVLAAAAVGGIIAVASNGSKSP